METQQINKPIFVFGSNTAGRHGLGAAKVALSRFGALYGQGYGLQGNSFGIPTKDHMLRVLPLGVIKIYVENFKDFAYIQFKNRIFPCYLLSRCKYINKFNKYNILIKLF